ncbi:replicative DNA helicase [Actinomadura sp. NPDC049753]|uniref:replicative DNA helicase n=1 Tax=Actinomadura sp. NPDC049753 TaxID=3154739 RepID=UPI003428452E
MTDDITLPGLQPTPAVVAAEMAVLGAAIERKAAAETAAEHVLPADFWNPQHQLVAEAVETLIGAGDPVSPVSVMKALADAGARFGEGGPGPFLFRLMEHRSADVVYDARIVAKDAIRRRVLQAVHRAAQIAARSDFEPDEDLDLIRQGLDAATSGFTGEQLPTIGEIVLRRLDEIEHGKADDDAVELPYADLQALLNGLRPGQVVIIGARPSVGKTVVGLDVARFAAIRRGLPTLFFSLEMSSAELADRLVAAEARVNLHAIRARNLKDDDWHRIADRTTDIGGAPLVIDDNPACTLARIRARLRGMARTRPARLVVIDYLGLMDAPRADSRERQVAELSRGLKLLAKEFSVPIVALSQLNRESTKRNDRRPTMSDLRDSGAVEQDADIVILLHREDAYEKESPRSGEIDLIVDKHRAGPTGTVTAAFQGHYARVMDMAPEPTPREYGHLQPVPDLP